MPPRFAVRDVAIQPFFGLAGDEAIRKSAALAGGSCTCAGDPACREQARLAEQVDARDLKSLAFGRAGSSPAAGTKVQAQPGREIASILAAMMKSFSCSPAILCVCSVMVA